MLSGEPREFPGVFCFIQCSVNISNTVEHHSDHALIKPEPLVGYPEFTTFKPFNVSMVHVEKDQLSNATIGPTSVSEVLAGEYVLIVSV